ncbi:MAG: DUF5681 domain-containing protein [Acidobacteriaceae bacterium]
MAEDDIFDDEDVSDDENSTEETGYGKPPKKTRFRKGQSGNPRGRPKGSRSFTSVFRDVCAEKVTVKGPRGPRTMTKVEAGLTQLANKAASGDLKAIQHLIRWNKDFGQLEPRLPTPIFGREFVSPKDVRRIQDEEREKEEEDVRGADGWD